MSTARNLSNHAAAILRDLQVEYRSIAELKLASRQTRTHSKRQIRQIGNSIIEFGFTVPVLIDESDSVLAGHGRIAAAKIIGLDKVPVIRVSNLSPAQKRAYAIADNKLAEKAGWDRQALGLELQELSVLDIPFELEVTGFETAEIDLLIGEAKPANDNDPADAIIAPDPVAVTRPGDLWLMDQHRLLCGDATKPQDYARLMDGRRAQMVFTDPPYNVDIDGHVCGSGKIKHREFAMASGEMSGAEFTAFLGAVFALLATHSADGSIHFVCMDWRHLAEVLGAGSTHYTGLKNICVWNKTNGGMGSLYRSKHELVLVFKNGAAPHINTVELGKHGRYRTNVWDYAGVNGFGAEREGLALHPTVKPVALVADAILDCSKRKGIVLDPFSGSGTTLIAAEKTGRAFYGMELDPVYVDVALKRWQDWTGERAIHAATGQTFAAIAEQRRVQDPPDPEPNPPTTAIQKEAGHD